MLAEYAPEQALSLKGLSSTFPEQPHFLVKTQLPEELYQLDFAV